MSKKYYAVAKGIKPGIYSTWEEAKAQAEGYKNPLYKGFSSKKEAEEWLKNPSFSKTPANNKKDEYADADNDTEVITIYTDGCSLGNPGPGGFGIVFIYPDKIEELSAGFSMTTNNRMELMGVIEALKNLKIKDKKIRLWTDSSYVVNGITKGWAKKWQKNNWIKSDKSPALNKDLWEELLSLVERLDIEFNWIKGHAGNKYNERCDRLAVEAAKGENLSRDYGYK